MKVSILAVGTELTTGQVINKNAAWIADKLKSLGILSVLHITVPDDHQSISEALEYSANHSDFLFVTGGLGPTSDDFTRNVIAEWAQLDLKFHQASWLKVQERLTSKGIPIQEMQKQQCYFPDGANILLNNQGTANGFSFLTKQQKKVYVLPGPPNEIKAIWNEHIHNELYNISKTIDKCITFSWDTLGLGESQIAEKVITATEEPDSKINLFELGYRVHFPYVEVKFSFFESQQNQALKYVQKIDSALDSWTLVRQGENVAQVFCDKIEKLIAKNTINNLSEYNSIQIYDAVSDTFLLQRIVSYFPKWSSNQQWTISSQNYLTIQTQQQQENKAYHFYLSPINEFTALVGFRNPSGDKKELKLESVHALPTMTDRRKQYFSELALNFWKNNL